MKKYKNMMMIIAIIVVAIAIGGVLFSFAQKQTKKVKNPVATIEIENFGTIKLELYPDVAPNTVTNFIKLANNGYYNEKKFYRIISDFMIQGGSESATSQGAPKLSDIKEGGADEEYAIKGEFIANGFEKNTVRHERGVISMARADYSSMGMYEEGYNSAGADFFIMTENNSGLNGSYAAFGKMIEGYDVLDAVAKVEVKASSEEEGAEVSTPVEPPVIKSISVDTFGVDYGEPETVKPFDYSAWIQQMFSQSIQ